MLSVYIGLGSNIDPEDNLRKAAQMLRDDFPEIRFSHVYRTAPQDKTDQPEFLNAVAFLKTDEEAEDLAAMLEEIEVELDKDPPYPGGPRTIDLDILLYGSEHIGTEDLTIPHPRMHKRRFVLEPLIDIANGGLEHPVSGETLTELLDKVEDQPCTVTEIAL